LDIEIGESQMAVVCNTEVNGKAIDWNHLNGEGSADHSTLFGPLRDGRSFGRVYDDAADEGFAIQGNQSRIVFVVDGIERDEDGDVQYWILRSINAAGHVDERFKIHVWND
jgi:hypothetical protein